MKKIACVCLALFMLLGHAGLADGEDWERYDSVFGFSILYPAEWMDAYGIPAEEAGWDTEMFAPRDESGAAMWCQMITDPALPDWEGEDWRRVTVDEPSVEMDVSLDMDYALYLSADGTEMVEEIRLLSPVSVLDCPAGFEYVFDLRFPAADEAGWRETMERMLETVSFPPQAAEAGSFRLEFFEDRGLEFTDVWVDEEAEPIVLMPLRAVENFALEKLTWDDEAFQVIETETLFAADALAPGDSLKIYCWFSDVLPDLRVRCVSENGEAECWYLFQSGRDGSLMLLSEAD